MPAESSKKKTAAEQDCAKQPVESTAVTKAPPKGARPKASGRKSQPPKAAGRKAPAKKPAPAKKGKKRAPLPGPKVKRAPKKAIKRKTTREKLISAEKRAITEGPRPLDGVRVLDVSRLLPGPYASHLLATFGAEVIKIEKPGEGDYMREYLPKVQGFNAAFLTINRGKKSLAINLKHKEGREAFRELAKGADVLLDGFRPGRMAKLGLGYEQLRKINPKLVYAALTGYGQDGRYSQQAGHDLNYMATSGMLELLGKANNMPAVPGVQIADVAAGALPTVIGILLGLQHRNQTGEGQMVDISMFDSLLGLMPVQVANYSATKLRPKRGQERLFGRYACYNVYPVRNSRYLAVAALEPKFWEALCEVIGREDLIEDQYVEGDAQEILKAELTRTFQKRDVSDWVEIFSEVDVCVTEVREISRAVQDEAVAERDMVTPIRGTDGTVYEQLGVFPKLSETPGYIVGDAPLRGAHTRELLASLDYAEERIEELLEQGVVEDASAP